MHVKDKKKLHNEVSRKRIEICVLSRIFFLQNFSTMIQILIDFFSFTLDAIALIKII